MKVFGMERFFPDDVVVPVPITDRCGYCGENFISGDAGAYVPHLACGVVSDIPYHQECQTRMFVGSVAHIKGECRCAVDGSTDTDPPGMTKREAAKAAIKALQDKTKLEQAGSRHLNS